jgi:putative IMPACT (imprinted ancient) family translation regulator
VLTELQLSVQFSDESHLRRLCEQKAVSILNASYAERVTLHLQLKADDAKAFESMVFDLLRGDVQKIKMSDEEQNTTQAP